MVTFEIYFNSLGDLVPFGDPAWYQGNYSPFYNDSHRRMRSAMRSFLEKEVRPYITEWDESKHIPRDLLRKFGEAGFLPGVIGFWPKKYVGTNIAGNVKVEEWDSFHELIMIDEVCRMGSGGLAWLFCGMLYMFLTRIRTTRNRFTSYYGIWHASIKGQGGFRLFDRQKGYLFGHYRTQWR